MADFSVTIQGLQPLISSFEKAGVALPLQFQRAMVASTVAVKQTAQELVPVKTGALRQSISEVVQDNPLTGTVSVGQPYGKDVEFGTGPHVIVPVNAKALAFKVNGQMVFATRVNHPGTKAHPFMRPAMEQNTARIQANFQQAAQAVLDQIKGA